MALKRVLTGIRPTGKLHLGHYVGALEQWVKIQQDPSFDCFFLLADLQALTTHSDRPHDLPTSVKEIVLDWLSVGLDPQKANVNFVLQSQVLERHLLSLLFQLISYKNEVERNPTLKSELKDQEGKSTTVGFMTYPVDQVADICMVSPYPFQKENQVLVPVGEDQVPHLEYARVLARRFNEKYGEVFTPCSALVGKVGRLVGTDGQAKMSKSLNNCIYLSDDQQTVKDKVKKMFTDPKRTSPDVPGETKNNPVFIYHRAFNPNQQEVADLAERYQKGKVGDVEVKEKLALALNTFLEPIRERRASFEKIDIREILVDGTSQARKSCQQITQAAMEKMFLTYP